MRLSDLLQDLGNLRRVRAIGDADRHNCTAHQIAARPVCDLIADKISVGNDHIRPIKRLNTR